jgi:TolB-like protein
MKFTYLSLIVGLSLCGCTSVKERQQYRMAEAASQNIHQESGSANLIAGNQTGTVDQLDASANFQRHYQQQLLSKNGNAGYNNSANINPKNHNINHYVRGIMQDLVGNLQYVNSATPMAVTSFVFLDSDYSQSDVLGNQIAESFMHEIHKFGIPIIDYKTTDYVRVTPAGDFVLSRDFLELKTELPIRYVLVGTLTKHQSGVLVNARIVGMKSKAVVASAQGFLPSAITHSLMGNDLNDGIKLVSE